MSASFVLHPICVFAVFASVTSQVYDPYNQYGYQYYPSQGLNYNPYPYQPYVSNPYVSSYVNYAPSNFPFYGYPYSGQQAYSYPYTYPQYTAPQTYPSANNGVTNNDPAPKYQSEGQDPYAHIKTEIIDVEPKNFHYYKKFFNLEDNAYPVQVIDDDSVGSSGQPKTQIQPHYTVKTESTSYNYSSVPQGVSIHDVKSKSYSFKRTFTLDPSKKENAVINLNFVNGVQVTTTEPPQADSNREEEEEEKGEEANEAAATEEIVPTTTENEEPVGLSSWFK